MTDMMCFAQYGSFTWPVFQFLFSGAEITVKLYVSNLHKWKKQEKKKLCQKTVKLKVSFKL